MAFRSGSNGFLTSFVNNVSYFKIYIQLSFKETSTFKPLNENEIAEFVRNCHSKNIPIEIESNKHNEFYLKTKRDKLGHFLSKLNNE